MMPHEHDRREVPAENGEHGSEFLEVPGRIEALDSANLLRLVAPMRHPRGEISDSEFLWVSFREVGIVLALVEMTAFKSLSHSHGITTGKQAPVSEVLRPVVGISSKVPADSHAVNCFDGDIADPQHIPHGMDGSASAFMLAPGPALLFYHRQQLAAAV
jgi:hypothetical protein